MKKSEIERTRKVLLEAFTAGWQAGLAVKVTSPGALAVVESCFDLWLQEAADESDVLGLLFRRRYDLPGPASEPSGKHTALWSLPRQRSSSDSRPGATTAAKPPPSHRRAG